MKNPQLYASLLELAGETTKKTYQEFHESLLKMLDNELIDIPQYNVLRRKAFKATIDNDEPINHIDHEQF